MEELGFSFDCRTIDYFGSKSITSDITALFELIKNSRDANAKNIVIRFKQSHEPGIEVSDDGDGMSKEDIRHKWMVLGTDSRLKDSKTREGRPVWGEMGIGRMACQKLGSHTELITAKDGMETRMKFDWSCFDKPGSTVDKIRFPVESSSTPARPHGTTLLVKGLKSEWKSENINKLKNELSILISGEEFDSTKITVKTDAGEGDLIGSQYAGMRESVLNNAPFELDAAFDGRKLDISIRVRVGQKDELQKQEARDIGETGVGPFTARVYHFPRAPGKRKGTTIENYYKRRIETDKLEAFLKGNHGLYLYRDGAWMKPYGGDNDWLSMEAEARQETSKIGIKQIYGVVNLSKEENPNIKPASHRETLIENDGFVGLKKVLKKVFAILGQFMVDWKKENVEKTIKEMGGSTGNPGHTAGEIITELGKMSHAMHPSHKSQFKMCLSGLENMLEENELEAESAMEEMGEMRDYEKNLATLGIATSFMARNVTEPLERNMQMVAEGERMRERVSKGEWTVSKQDQEKSEEILNGLKDNQARMLHFMSFVSVLARHLAQSRNKGGRRTQVDVFECWDTVRKGFQDKERELGIGIHIDLSNPDGGRSERRLVVKIDRIDLECVLTNLYLNSIEALAREPAGQRAVRLRYWHSGDSLYVEFSDNGPGIPKNRLEEVFEPFKLGHSPSNDEMHGHGMGLHTVRKIMENYQGTAEALEVEDGTTIRLVFNGVSKVAI